MPDRVYHPLHDPPTWWERILSHPLETMVAVTALAFGVLVATSLFLPEFVPSKSMDRMPVLIVVFVSGFLAIGGALGIIGLNYRGEDVSNGWALERFGFLLAAGGFVTYTISVSWHYPGSVFAWMIPLLLGIGSALRVASLKGIEKATRRIVAEVEGGKRDA